MGEFIFHCDMDFEAAKEVAAELVADPRFLGTRVEINAPIGQTPIGKSPVIFHVPAKTNMPEFFGTFNAILAADSTTPGAK